MSTPQNAHHITIDESGASVKITFAGKNVVDTKAALILREGSIPPVYYVPRNDVRMDLLKATERLTHCPFKGDASYWTVVAGDKVAENAVWSYQQPFDQVAAIKDHLAFYVDRMDAFEVGD